MKRLFSVVLALLLAVQLPARVKLPAVLGSNMVLQRNAEVNFWGEASPRSRVRVTASWDGRTHETRADASGRWALKLPTGEAGGPYTVTLSDGEPLVLDNVLVGEVWVCSGQSNMEMPVSGFMFQPVEGAVDAIADAGMYPGIRMFTVPRVSSKTPLDDCDAAWQTATPASVGQFSAVGYFFGRMLYKALGIPVGLITSNWGGSTIEAWMTVDAIDATPGIDHAVAKSGTYDNSIPQRLYNGMILPVCRYTAKGFIWYQGESNRKNWYDYKALQVSLVKLWRETWGDGKMPFYYTQLAPYRYEGDELRSLPLVIEAQYRALAEIPHSGIAATTDLGNPTCIHPARKREVGERLAFLALANDYGVTGLPAPAPVYKSMERDGNKLVLTFDNLPVRAQNGVDSFVAFGPEGYCRPGGFEIAGEDRVFHPAVANFKYWDNRIEVSSDRVPDPVAVRYAFRNYCPEANVMTTMGQPLVPFRTDDWPLDDIGRDQVNIRRPCIPNSPPPSRLISGYSPLFAGIVPLILRLHCGRHRPSARGRHVFGAGRRTAARRGGAPTDNAFRFGAGRRISAARNRYNGALYLYILRKESIFPIGCFRPGKGCVGFAGWNDKDYKVL